ncbi:hypothetical protein JCM3770_007129 [Rhodotorula araucariae]
MPLQLADLPPELIPQLLAPLVSRRDLFHAALVSREWARPAQRLLLRHIRLFGRDLTVAPLLFQTLADNPHLARLVVKLEIRVYPLSMILRERLDMEQLAIRMLRNCDNVEELVWTRKGALTDRVFEAIKQLPRLRSFECNAHTDLSPGSWDADHFLDLPPLQSLSLILPDRKVSAMLPAFLGKQKALASTATFDCGQEDILLLEELSILCRESTVINDRVVKALAPALAGSRLTSLALAGCAKLTGAPLLDILPTLPHLRHLALEACALDPPFFRQAAPHLGQLRSLKLTHPGPRHPSLPAFFPALEALLDHTRALTAFTLYHSGASATGTREWPVLPHDFVQHVAGVVGARLRKFEVSGVLVGVETVERLTSEASELRNLVLHLGHDFDLPRLTAAFAPLATLRTLHLLSQRSDVTADDVLALAEQCAPTLRQIGFRNRVWLVKRAYGPAPAPSAATTTEPDRDRDPDPDACAVDKRHAKVSLGAYDLPWFPEALLVVRARQIRFVETAAAFGAFRRNRYGAESDADSEVDTAEEAGSESSEGDAEGGG